MARSNLQGPGSAGDGPQDGEQKLQVKLGAANSVKNENAIILTTQNQL